MSLHVELSPQARKILNEQRRNSTISSFLVSILSLVLIGMILGFFLLKPMVKEAPVIVTYQSEGVEEAALETRKVSTNMSNKPTAPSASMSRVIVSNTAAAVAVPVPDVTVSTPSLNFGDGDEFGTSWSQTATSSTSGAFSALPQTMNKRCSPEDRLARLRETGGTPECEAAVMKSLKWFKVTQDKNGGWSPSAHPVAMTGFTLLAYLGHCETPNSPEFGPTVSRAIAYLVSVGMKTQGPLTTTGQLGGEPPVYEHAIATYALAEAYTLCKGFGVTIPDLDKVVIKAGEIIINGQSPQGSWVYGYAKIGGDNCVGYWQIQALKACKHTGLFREQQLKNVIKNAHTWLAKVQGPDGAIGYKEDPKVSPGLTGGGVLAFQIWDEGRSNTARKGLAYMAKNAKFDWTKGGDQANLYYHYYNVQAMCHEGGKAWTDYNTMFRDSLLKAQKSQGYWERGGGGNKGASSVHMATCLATLMLEVYYRFLPGTGGR